MSLRRLAQRNNAATATDSPRPSAKSNPSSPVSISLPSTPRNRMSIGGTVTSPAATASISSSVPFDWEAARSRRPPPYGTPSSKGRKSLGGSTSGTPKKVIRKKGVMERITSIPSTIAFELSMFPHNVPLPEPTTTAKLVGGALHFLHFCTRVSQVRKIPDSDLGWEDMYREGEGDSWFDWTIPMTLLLISASILNTLYLFSRIRLYRLHHCPDPVSSPSASFVSSSLDVPPIPPPTTTARLWYAFNAFWRFLLNMAPPKSPYVNGNGENVKKVQQLEVWTPGEAELYITLFVVYSPAHAVLWMGTTSANWMLMFLIMGLVGAQTRMMTRSYEVLLKDKEIIYAEVMHEYNQGFVYPRVNPIRKDVAVMTHQSEVVNIWEHY